MTRHLAGDAAPPPTQPRAPAPFVIAYDGDAADPFAAADLPADLPDATGAGAVQIAARLAAKPGSAFGRLAFWVFTSLFTLILGAAAWRFVTGLFSANVYLGWLGFGLTGLALLIVAVLTLQEIAAFARMARLDRLRMAAATALASADLTAARRVVDDIASLYANRPDTAWGLSRLAETRNGIFDADALLALAETEVIAPLDRAALLQIEAAARQVAIVTAFVPMALADVATVLYSNLKLIRHLSEIYGGRSGTIGSFRLLRRVFAAVLGAGAVALADDLLGSVASGGILAKVSRRFGEGVVNGALTARVGIAAMELSRPLAFTALKKPGTSATTSRALAGVFGKAAPQSDTSR